MPDSSTQRADDTGMLLVSLPAHAKLFVNGKETSSEGDLRRFVSRGLKAGFRYPYSLKAVIEQDGKEIVSTRDVALRPGRSARVEFDFAQSVETKVTIKLPADAELVLAGTKTKSTGTTRTFTTKKLAEGQLWEDYVVTVSMNQNGKTLTQEKTISLRGGEDRTLEFDLTQDHVAAR
jgi:uncharacterized protein (TIGR03000 family)